MAWPYKHNRAAQLTSLVLGLVIVVALSPVIIGYALYVLVLSARKIPKTSIRNYSEKAILS